MSYPEQTAVDTLRADGIDAELYHTGGGIMVAAVWLGGDREGAYVWVSDAHEYDGEGGGRWLVGWYHDYEDEGRYTIADCLPAMIESVREGMKELQ